MQTFDVTVSHELGFYSHYDIKARDKHDAEKEAEKRFIDDFCNGNTKYKLSTYSFLKTKNLG